MKSETRMLIEYITLVVFVLSALLLLFVWRMEACVMIVVRLLLLRIHVSTCKSKAESKRESEFS